MSLFKCCKSIRLFFDFCWRNYHGKENIFSNSYLLLDVLRITSGTTYAWDDGQLGTHLFNVTQNWDPSGIPAGGTTSTGDNAHIGATLAYGPLVDSNVTGIASQRLRIGYTS
ncbi:MAG TPA: hypothetical protein DDX75_02295 [Phycisphaerales bacterium]|nr:hypothetical protein [Phycisphaerales bacterium]